MRIGLAALARGSFVGALLMSATAASAATYMYVGNAGTNEIIVFSLNPKNGELTEMEKLTVPGITALDARGHSPGHTAFLVTSGNGKLLVTSDTVNHQILIRNPDWALWADMDPGMAVTARKRLLDMAAADRMQIAAYHLPFPSTGFISKQGSGYEFHPAYWQPVL